METKVHDFTIKTDTAPFLEAYQFSAVFFTRAKCLFNFSIASSTSLIALANSAGSRVSPQSGTGITSRFEPADDLFALVTALRTGNLDSFFLEHGDLSFTRSQPTKDRLTNGVSSDL